MSEMKSQKYASVLYFNMQQKLKEKQKNVL